MNKLTVKGTGKIKESPDLIVLRINIKVLEDTYKYASELGERLTKDVKNLIEKTGFNKKDIKTSNFYIDQEYDYITETRNNTSHTKKVFKGYKLTHSLKLEFDYDTQKLGEILDKLSIVEDSIEVDIDFTIKDKETLRNKLLENAIFDAKTKADIICNAAGVKLKNIVHIDYKVGNIRLNSPSRIENKNIARSVSLFEDDNFEAEYIEKTDTVTVIWEIF